MNYRLRHQSSKKINKGPRLGYIPPQELRNNDRTRDSAHELQEEIRDIVEKFKEAFELLREID